MSPEQTFLNRLPISILADNLHPLFISDMDTPGRESDGFGWRELGDASRAAPMMARLPTEFRLHDEVNLYWTTTKPASQPPLGPPVEDPVQTYTLSEEIEERGWLSFAVNKAKLNLPDDNQIPYPYFGYFYYSLYDPSAGDIGYSEYREVLIDLVVPGKPNEDSTSPINDNLFAAVVVPQRIEPPYTGVKLTINPWAQMQVDDLVTLIWNGVRFESDRRLDQGDLGSPWVIDVPADLIREGGSGEQLLVQYEIRDRVQNYSRLSKPAAVTVEDPNALAAPDVDGAETFPFTLDLDRLGGGDVTIYLPDYVGYLPGDTVYMHWVGLTAEGQQVTYDFAARPINGTRDKTFKLPYDYAALVVNGSATVFYESVPVNGGAPRPSRRRTIMIIGASVVLLPPVLVEAVNDTIDLATLTEQVVHVRIPLYPAQRENDVVTLFWTGDVGEGGGMTWETELTVPPGGEATELVFEVGLPFLSPLVGGTLTLSYSVHTPEFDVRRSSSERTYTVEDSLAVDYPAPTCAQVQGTGADAFLPSDTPVAVVVIPTTAPLSPGQQVTLHWEAVGGTPLPHTQTKPFQNFPFSFDVNNVDILPFEDVDVSVTYSVA